MKTRITNPFRSSISAIVTVFTLSCFAAPSASALDYYWDSDGATAGFGTAAGTWTVPTTGDATQGWSTSTTGELLPADITTATTDRVFFGNGITGLGAGTITVSGTVSAGNMTFASGSGAVVLSGGTLTNLDAQTITVNSATHTISSVMGGAATTFVIGGSGTLALTNEANTFVGRTVIGNNTANSLKLQVTKLANLNTNSSLGAPATIANGLIQIGAGSQPSTLELIGSTSPSSTNRQVRIGVSANGSGGSTILNNNTDAAHTLTFSNTAFNQAATNVTSSSRSLTLGGSNPGNNTISGAIIPNTGGAGLTSFVKTGAGTWILNGANSYNGNTTVSDGILVLGGSNSQATTTAVNGTGTLHLRSNSNGGLASGNLIFNSSSAIVQASNADRSITNQAVLNANGTVSGNFSLSLGNLLVNNGNRELTNSISSPKSLTVASISANGAHSLTINGTGTTTVTGTVSLGAGTLTKNTGGKLKFSTAGSNASDVIVSGGAGAGALVSADNEQHISTGDFNLNDGATLVIDYGSTTPTTTVAPLAVDSFTVGSGLSLLVEGSTLSSLAVGQAYPLVTWTTSGPVDNSAFTTLLTHRLAGTFSVSSNTLFLNVTANAAGSPISWSTGSGTWDTSTSNWLDGATPAAPTTYFDTLDAVLFGDEGPTGDRVVTLDSASSPVGVTMSSTSRNYTISGTGGIGGSGDLTLGVGNTGTLTLTTANTYTGATQISGGSLTLGGSGTLGGGGNLTLGGGQLDLGTSSQTVGAVSTTAAAANGDTILNGNLTGNSYAASNATGNAVISANLLVNGSAGFAKSGAGIATLSGTNTYTGTTTVSGGILKLDSANALPGGIAASGGISALTINGGVLGLTADFLRPRGTTVEQVRWTDSGGFAAYGGDRTVNLGGTGATMTWNNSGFVPGGGGTLILSAADADGTLIWQNPISFAGSLRTIQVNNGSADIDARINGTLSAGTSSGLNKTGVGTLEITSISNSYSGATTVSAGTLRLGASNVLPDTTNVTIAAATLDAATSGTETVGTLDITGAATINVATGAKLAFTSGTPTWVGTLNLTGDLDFSGATTSSLNFGSSSGLSDIQLLAISATGFTNFDLDAEGNLTADAESSSGFDTWKTTNNAAGQSLNDDHDNDGVSNGIEYFIGGPNGNTTGLTTLPGVTRAGDTLSVTFTKAADYTGVYGTDYRVETSATLAAPWAPQIADPDPGFTVSFPSATEVKYTFPAGTKNFARLVVTGP